MSALRVRYVAEAAPTGYGRAARGYLRALVQAGAEVSWTPMVEGPRWRLYLEPFTATSHPDPEFGGLCNRPLDADVVVVHLLPHFIPHWRRRVPDRRLVAIAAWETDVLPAGWADALNLADTVIVPSTFNRDVFRRCGVHRPIPVVPHLPPDPPVTSDVTVPELEELPPDRFVFYSIGDWTERKGLHLTVRAFLATFSARDAVTLVVKTGAENARAARYGRAWRWFGRHLRAPAREVARMSRAHASPPDVRVITRQLDEAELAALHARGDCYVALTRGEGWGLGAFEAAWGGRPVIMTAHGGQLDYLAPGIAWLVDHALVPAAPRAAWEAELHHPPQRWAEPDLVHAGRLMREALRAPAEARRRGAALAVHVRDRFDSAKIMQHLLHALEGT